MKNLKLKMKTLLLLFLCLLMIAPVVSSLGEAKAASSYVLRVNKGTNVVTVYQNGTAVKAFICSVGNATPTGTFQTPQKYAWHTLNGNVYGQYCTRITGSILFHSVWYYQNGNKASQSYDAYNKLGTTASAGCVRLTVADAKWIYDNCSLGTTVVVFNGTSANDPLGKPASIKVNASQKMGWDPTDPDPANPYRYSQPTITYNGSQTIEAGSSFNPLQNISAKDSLGNNISSSVVATGSVNTKALGSYTVTYYVRDSLGRTSTLTVIFNVVDTQRPSLTLSMPQRQTLEFGTTISPKANISATNATGADLTSSIVVRVRAPGRNTATLKTPTLLLKRLGEYKISYSVVNPNNGKKRTISCYVDVVDTKNPIIDNIGKNVTVEYGKQLDIKSSVRARAATGKDITKYLKISVRHQSQKSYKKWNKKMYTFNKLGTYRIKYEVKNPQNKKSSSLTRLVKVKDTKKPIITYTIRNQTVEFNTRMDIKSKVKAYSVAKANLKKRLKIAVKYPGSSSYKTYKNTYLNFNRLGTYYIQYSVTNPKNKKTRVVNRTVKVQDTKNPTISNAIANRTVNFKSSLDVRTGVTAKAATKVSLTKYIKITLTSPSGKSTAITGKTATFNEVGTYKLVYSVTNPLNKKTATVTRTITSKDTTAPVINGVADSIASTGETVNLLSGVTASALSGTTNLTSRILVTVKAPDNQAVTVTNGSITVTAEGVYTVTYTVKADNAVSTTKTKKITVTKPTTPPVTGASIELEIPTGDSLELPSEQEPSSETTQDKVEDSNTETTGESVSLSDQTAEQ